MIEIKKASDIITPCNELQREWQIRDKKFRDWYSTLQLVDTLSQKGMESYTSNDPRTFYKMSLHLLTPEVIPHRIIVSADDLSAQGAIGPVSEFLEGVWHTKDLAARRSGRGTWLRHLVSLLLITGWYSVFALSTQEDLIAEIWNPGEVYPEFDDQDLVRCAHVFKLNAPAAVKRIRDKKWVVKREPKSEVTVYDYWFLDDTGKPTNAIVLGTEIVKPPIAYNLSRIPIHCGPVGGIPDDGTIMGSTAWRAEIGQSILAVNENLYLSQNKVMTFLMQLLRDTAENRWLEKSRGGDAILTDENIFKRGAIFRATPEDSVETLPVNPIPVEVRTVLMNIENQVQRGSLPWSIYGNIQQQIASYMMSQIATSAKQVLSDYRNAVKGLLEDIDHDWLVQMLAGTNPRKFQFPGGFPQPPTDFQVDVGLDVTIPGDLVMRSTTARMLSPNLKLSEPTTMRLMFPEVKDPAREIAAANADSALKHPLAITISLIGSFKDQANKLRDSKNPDLADLFDAAAEKATQGIVGAGTTGGSKVQPTPETPPPAGNAGEIPPRGLTGVQ